MHIVGEESVVASHLSLAIDRSIDILEENLRLNVSRKKSIVTTSSSTLTKKLRAKLGKHGIAVKSKVKMLGIDFSCGKIAARSAQRSRVMSVDSRRSKYARLGKRAAGRLVKAGAAPAMQYGACVYGTPNTTLKKVRGFACAVKGEMRGRSTFARLELARFDPGAACAISPIVEWARAIWDSTAKCEDLRVVWQRAHTLIASSPTPFRHVAGPGGAMLASCRRIGWKWPSFDAILRADGSPLVMNRICPAQIRLHAVRDLRAVEAAASSLAKRIGGPPDLEPLGDFLATKKFSDSPAAASVRALGEGGWWTQARLHQEGRVDTKWCKACGSRGNIGPVEGTLHHRLCACIATAALRDKFKDQEILQKAQSVLHGEAALFQHGVPLLSSPPMVPRREVNCCGGKQMPKDFSASGNAFTDGAMKGRAPKAARRAGWSWVVVDDNGCVIFGLYGPCPDPFPTAFRAELRAVCELLVLALPPLTIWVDNQAVIDGWLRGKQWCTSSSRSAADLWSDFWQRIEDIGSDGIVLKKTKGHATEVDVQQGRSTAFQKAGNDHADHFAGRAVELAIHRSPNDSAIDDYRVAIRWYKWVLLLSANWPDDVDERPRTTGDSAGSGRRKRKAEVSGTDWLADTTKSSADAGAAQSMLDVVKEHALHPSHQFKLNGSLLWCSRCGSYGQHRFKSLKSKCAGPSTAKSKGGQLAQLKKGLHPLTGARLGADASASAASNGPTAMTLSATIPSSRTSSATTPSSRTPSAMTTSARASTARAPLTKAASARRTTSASSTSRAVSTRADSVERNCVGGTVTSESGCIASRIRATKALVCALSRPTYRALGVTVGKLV